MSLSGFIVETYPIPRAGPERRLSSLDGAFPASSGAILMTGGLIRTTFGL